MSDVVELGLRRANDPPAPESSVAQAGNPLKGLAEAFLKVMADFSPAADDQDAKAFAATIKDFRDQIAFSGHDQETRRLAAASIRACEIFLKKSRHYFVTREVEFKEVISILASTAKHFAGDSAEFHAVTQAATDKFLGIAQLDDLRELKRQLTDEANNLQKAIDSKHKRDEEMLSALNDKVQTLQAHLEQAEEQASLDPLTKIPNRGTFDKALAKAMKQARASKVPLALAMLDIDHFKKINDAHGHPIGDRVILCVAQWVSAAVRHTDVVARYGGEEFAVIMPDADLGAAEMRFKTVLQQIASRSFEYQHEGQTRSVRFTVSCGVTQLSPNDTDMEFVQRADQALYDAKKTGRNRVVAKKRSKLGALFGG